MAKKITLDSETERLYNETKKSVSAGAKQKKKYKYPKD